LIAPIYDLKFYHACSLSNTYGDRRMIIEDDESVVEDKEGDVNSNEDDM